ncbi:hypothetical protein DFR28_1157 [Arenicella xantha]|uniref:DUF6869 domain-containing protein n=1 Tax=Arenicella xantha TaxID=644221 RepID=A0A395JEB6_9GAMM|nr:hypothetical protein DFR28_1157 [Arenicella xantha]
MAYAEGVEHDPSNEAIQEFIDVTYDEPEISWKAILEIMSRGPNERVIGALSAGPLEDIIHYHGDAFIERIEEQARNDPSFRHLLGGVWRGGSIEIWNRVIKARNYKSW